MTTATVQQIQQEYIDQASDIADKYLSGRAAKHDCNPANPLHPTMPYIPREQITDCKDLAVAALKGAGLDKEAEAIDLCGKSYSVSKCDSCGEYIGHAHHCNQRLCPDCYYRNLHRFMNRHRDSWDETLGFTLVAVDYGGYRSYDLEEGMARAKDLHRDLIARFPFLKGGVYHIELKLDDVHGLYRVLYHYLLNADAGYAFLFAWALNGEARLQDHMIFENYDQAAGYFVRHCCQYPAGIVLDSTQVAFYLSLVKHHRLIQGFREFYRIAGGLNHSPHPKTPHRCPICNGKLSYCGRTTRQYCSWDQDISCYRVDPGAAGL